MGTIKSPNTPHEAAPATAHTGLADALFSTTQQRVLGLLFGQPGRSFYANELIALTGGGSGAVQRELARLAHSGLITQQTIGRQKHYQANASAPIFGELCAIASKTMSLAPGGHCKFPHLWPGQIPPLRRRDRWTLVVG